MIKSKNICAECGGLCCKLGGVVATRNEVDAIIERGYPNYFVKIANGTYGTNWGNNGTCPYFQNNKCSIHAVRPLGCRLYPVVQSVSREILLIECPLATYLSEKIVQNRKMILLRRPGFIAKMSELFRGAHTKELQMRNSKYNQLVL